MQHPDRKVREQLDWLLRHTFADPAAAEAWLQRAVPLLDGRRPADLIREGRLEPVIQVLAGGIAGAFA